MPVRLDGALPLVIAGEPMVLLGARALYWPARKRLIIADLHLGKAHVFRQAGIAIPQGTTSADLQRLTELVTYCGARELWIVGDVLHGPSPAVAWKSAWLDWRRRHHQLDVALLAGNHDRQLAKAGLGARLLGDRCEDGPFLFRHEPQPDTRGLHVIAGHLHPKVRLAGVPRSWPAFWLKPDACVLPAFSEFTGGVTVYPGKGERLLACVEGSVVAVGNGMTTRSHG